MAFPYDVSQLRAQLRAYSLATAEGDFDPILRIIKPLELGMFREKYNTSYLSGLEPRSPPVPLDLPEYSSDVPKTSRLRNHKRQASRAVSKAGQVRRKSRQSVPSRHIQQAKLDELSLISTVPSQRQELTEAMSDPSELDRKLREKKNPITKLFTKNERWSAKDSDSDSLDLSILTSDLAYSEASGTISSSTSQVTSGHTILDDEYPESDYNTLEHQDESGSELESYSDSAFTDMNDDSLLGDTQDIAYEYTVPERRILAGEDTLKQRETSVTSLANKYRLLNQSSLLPVTPVNVGSIHPQFAEHLNSIYRPRTALDFSKSHTPVSEIKAAPSNLSAMIRSRSTYASLNPLEYFATRNSHDREGALSCKSVIFMAPDTHPVLNDLTLASSMSVFDCIGLILLEISKMPKHRNLLDDLTLVNPNRWRLELTDDDGELYDSNFGVLERTRAISSYNCPKYLALCRVRDQKEFEANQKTTPIPPEFEHYINLIGNSSGKTNESTNLPQNSLRKVDVGNLENSSVEVKVTNIPSMSSGKFLSYYVAPAMQVGELLDLVCRQYQLDPAKFRLLQFEKGGNPESTTMDSDLMPLDSLLMLDSLDTKIFKLHPVQSQVIKSMLDVKSRRSAFLEVGITPNSYASLKGGITPPRDDFSQDISATLTKLDDAEEALNPSSKTVVRKVSNEARNVEIGIGDLIRDKRYQVPSSLNTTYLKWRVYRKKAPLLYRLERLLIIDGEYIHLAPTDDATFKSNADSQYNTMSQSGHHHHHHYLHHYNYSKYYSDTILKTSSFHISQIVKLKHYLDSKNPNSFKIVIQKEIEQSGKIAIVKKRYELEAESLADCDEILEKIRWAQHLFAISDTNL